MNGSKRARNQNTIINRTNTCGGVKKAGTAPRVGFFLSSNVGLQGVRQSVPKTCVISKTVQVQRIGYKATLA